MSILAKRTVGGRVIFYIDDFLPNITASKGDLCLSSDGSAWVKTDTNDEDWSRLTFMKETGFFSGGNDTPANVNKLDINTTGSESSFPGLAPWTEQLGCASSITRSIWGGGTSSGTNRNYIRYLQFTAEAYSQDFGDLLDGTVGITGFSSQLRGFFAGGYTSGYINVIQYVANAVLSNSSDFGDLTESKRYLGGCSAGTRGFAFGGTTGVRKTEIDYIDMTATPASNASDFGDLNTAVYSPGACASRTRCFSAGGWLATSGILQIDYFDPTATPTITASDFGDLTVARGKMAGLASQTRAVFAGGDTDIGESDVMDYVDIASTGNASDFGDLDSAKEFLAGGSNCHGGL